MGRKRFRVEASGDCGYGSQARAQAVIDSLRRRAGVRSHLLASLVRTGEKARKGGLRLLAVVCGCLRLLAVGEAEGAGIAASTRVKSEQVKLATG